MNRIKSGIRLSIKRLDSSPAAPFATGIGPFEAVISNRHTEFLVGESDGCAIILRVQRYPTLQA
jgi:hypothetical protein